MTKKLQWTWRINRNLQEIIALERHLDDAWKDDEFDARMQEEINLNDVRQSIAHSRGVFDCSEVTEEQHSQWLSETHPRSSSWHLIDYALDCWGDQVSWKGAAQYVIVEEIDENNNKKIVGFCSYRLNKDNIEIRRLLVDPAYEKRQEVVDMTLHRLYDKLTHNRRTELTIDIPETKTWLQEFFRDYAEKQEKGHLKRSKVIKSPFHDSDEDAYRLTYSVLEKEQAVSSKLAVNSASKHAWKNRVQNYGRSPDGSPELN